MKSEMNRTNSANQAHILQPLPVLSAYINICKVHCTPTFSRYKSAKSETPNECMNRASVDREVRLLYAYDTLT